MKCQKCGNNNATFHYKASINGQKTEMHLCAECAEKEGFTQEDFFGKDMFESIFSDFFGDFFAPSRNGFFPGFGRMTMPVMTLPRIELVVKNDEAEKEKEKVTAPKDEEMSKRRELNALREKMKSAVEAENFEEAAKLRDEIRELENKG